jgi:predicted nicotinamide N-methyase
MIANLLQRTHEVHGEQMLYRFGNGLIVKTEHLGVKTPLRILGLGSPQNTLLNYMLNFPDTLSNKDAFDPFAGSGVLGLMALKVGARSVTFLDINPRAVEFQTENARLNHFTSKQFFCHEGDIRTFCPERKFDWLFANPPFVPTPGGITEVVHSNGGAEGNTLV